MIASILRKIRRSIHFRIEKAGLRRRRSQGRIRVQGLETDGSKYGRFSREASDMIGSLEGSRVLEIGSDGDAGLLRVLSAKHGVSTCVGVNPLVQTSVIDEKIRLLNGDCCNLPFPEGHFDSAVSISVFEHVTCLGEVLSEVYRVLKPGGLLYSEFGPIWSSVWGHHLWIHHDGEIVDWNRYPLPPFAHLLMQPDELAGWCEDTYGDRDLAGKISKFVFTSEEQNRLFFSDYCEIFNSSKFEVALVTGCPDLPQAHWRSERTVAATLEELAKKFPGKTGFGYHVVRVLLRKPLE